MARSLLLYAAALVALVSAVVLAGVAWPRGGEPIRHRFMPSCVA